MKERRLTRRVALKTMGVAVATAALAACGGPAPISVTTPVALPRFAPDSYMQVIQDRGQLIAGINTDVRLFGFSDPNIKGDPDKGFDVDIAREIARAIFGSPDRLQIKEMTSAARIPSLKEDLVDLVAATMTITKARLQQVDFSDVYYESAQMILVPKNSAIKGIHDTAGKRVCAAKGSTSIDNITRLEPRAVPVQTIGWLDCLDAVHQGKADAISTDDVILMGLANQDPNQVLLQEKLTQEPYGIAIAQGRSGFLDFVNAVLSDLKKNGRWAQIHEHWLGPYLPTPAPPTRTARDAAV